MHRNATQYEAGADVRFGLAYERLAAADASRMRELDRMCGVEDPDETDRVVVEFKSHSAPGRCRVFGCRRMRRAKGMCEMHYRRAKEGRELLGPPHPGVKT